MHALFADDGDGVARFAPTPVKVMPGSFDDDEAD